MKNKVHEMHEHTYIKYILCYINMHIYVSVVIERTIGATGDMAS